MTVFNQTVENPKDYAYRLATLELEHFNKTASMSTKPFYNTINLSSEELKVENAKARGLENIIQVVFNAIPTDTWSGWQMKHYLQKILEKKVNLNSVRRSMTNLKNKGVITKTETMVMGDEGKNEHLYKLTSLPSTKPSFINSKVSQASLF